MKILIIYSTFMLFQTKKAKKTKIITETIKNMFLCHLKLNKNI